MPLPDALKILLSIALIAPLAFAMGMPFPLGLARTAEGAPSLVPWAWGVNGCASVVAAILATMLAIHLGFGVVVVLAVLLYARGRRRVSVSQRRSTIAASGSKATPTGSSRRRGCRASSSNTSSSPQGVSTMYSIRLPR